MPCRSAKTWAKVATRQSRSSVRPARSGTKRPACACRRRREKLNSIQVLVFNRRHRHDGSANTLQGES